MSYENWRITYQSSEAAARSAYEECERLRKDAERWRAVLQSGAYCPSVSMSKYSSPIGFAGRSGQYSDDELNASVDAYIERRKANP